MSPERWQQVKEIVDGALDLAPAEQGDWLAEACGDEELRRQAAAYLAWQERSAGYLEVPAGSLLARRAERRPPEPRIGPYRIVRLLGRGGAGDVYLAIREDAFVKEVAIKLLADGLGSAAIVRRFERERQILARLEHPGIARILDGGSTGDGRPYFVLEYVEGMPIDCYCARHELTIGERLVLFRQVCSAVAFAHRRLVIHRDLKPGNILVTDTGEPKLLDFGIATLLHPRGSISEEREPGRTLRRMTPGYASPEQVRGQTITTASDVFSLGVLLHELLTGGRLQPHGPCKRTALVGCERRPPAPSEAVTGGDRRQVARRRRRLRGDLDRIVLKALAEDPARRYSSVEQLASDLERHLQRRPVVARSGEPGYRAERFVRRHWAPLAVAAAFFLLVAGFAVHSHRQAVELEQALRATRSENGARSVGDTPEEAGELIDLSAALLRTESPEDAEPYLRRALALLEERRGEDRPGVLADEDDPDAPPP